jgi:hypothetical protein
MLTRIGCWFPLAFVAVVVPATVSAFHMSQPPENPNILIVAVVAVLIMMIGVIIAMVRGRSAGKFTKKKWPRQRGRGKGRGGTLY